MQRSSLTSPFLLACALIGGWVLGCDQDPSGLRCGPHGEAHGDHCHCHSGYHLDGDGTGCVAMDGGTPVKQGRDAGAAPSLDSGVALEADASVSLDAGSLQDPDAGSGPPSLRFERMSAEIRYQTDENGGVWVYSARGGTMRLSVENYEALGGLGATGVRTVGAAETDYALCGICVVLSTECTVQGCSKVFMPEVGGQISITQLGTAQGQRFAGSLDSLVFREVTIDRASYETRTVAGGDRFALEMHTWDEAIPALPCGGHGHLHGTTCHCDPGYRVDPTNRMNCIPN